jgi:hypothetical protein
VPAAPPECFKIFLGREALRPKPRVGELRVAIDGPTEMTDGPVQVAEHAE